MSIDKKRPVTGADIESVREKLGVSIREFAGVLGINLNLYYTLIEDKNRIVDRKPVCLMARWYDKHPEDFPVLKAPTLGKIQLKLKELGVRISSQNLVLLFGRSKAAYYRYVEFEGNENLKPASANAKSTMKLFYDAISKGGLVAFNEWVRNAEAGEDGQIVYDIGMPEIEAIDNKTKSAQRAALEKLESTGKRKKRAYKKRK
jgi:hypothetical protein